MTYQRRPWTQRLLDLLEQGPCDRESLMRQTIPWVPQGHAYRTREQFRLRFLQRNGDATDGRAIRPRTPGQIHAIGAREVLNRTLNNLVRNGLVAQDGDTFTRILPRRAGHASAGAAEQKTPRGGV